MPSSIRKDDKIAKIAYKIMNTPKDRQQRNKKPCKKLLREWHVDSSAAQ
jgi:hypothetical protein